ncbi:MAG: DNA recombination protein RmuC [Rickettsiales bacterium]
MEHALICAIVFLAVATAYVAARLRGRGERLAELKAENERLRTDLAAARENALLHERENAALQQRADERAEDIADAREGMQAEFKRVASELFDEKNRRFAEASRESLHAALVPFRENVADFRRRMDEAFGDHAKEQFALKSEIARIVAANDRITLQAENLANALKGDVKTQGDWGEIMLEKLLEDSGLRKDDDYVLQGEKMGWKHPESGAHSKPDVVVRLPDERYLIIDAKVSLTHYERFCAEKDEATKAAHLKDFKASVRAHAAQLEARRYQDIEAMKNRTPDFVLMFMPIEGAYALALQNDRELHAYAWARRVAVVSPTALFATLRTVECLWKLDKQNRNALAIADAGGKLYDKIASFAGDMEKLGNQIDVARNTYDTAYKKLREGPGNILKRTKDLEKLGVKASKPLPSHDEEEE